MHGDVPNLFSGMSRCSIYDCIFSASLRVPHHPTFLFGSLIFLCRYMSQKLLDAGEMPDANDPVSFSWWLVDVLPVNEYRLAILKSEGARKRLESLQVVRITLASQN